MWSPRRWLPVLGWCASTLASIAAATVALQPVLRTATPGLAAPEPKPPVAGRATVAPVPSLQSTEPPVVNPPSRPPPSNPPSSPPLGQGHLPNLGHGQNDPVPAPETTTADGWAVSTGADGKPTYLRSFTVAGGQAVIRMVPGQAQVVTATPSDGYRVDTVQNEPGNLAVQFTQGNHYFIIHAVWHDNAPFAEVSEVGS